MKRIAVYCGASKGKNPSYVYLILNFKIDFNKHERV